MKDRAALFDRKIDHSRCETKSPAGTAAGRISLE